MTGRYDFNCHGLSSILHNGVADKEAREVASKFDFSFLMCPFPVTLFSRRAHECSFLNNKITFLLAERCKVTV
jgi:hypothetical protein